MVLPQDDAEKENPNQPPESNLPPLPGWLKPDSPPGAVQPAPSMPDWLKASSPGLMPSRSEPPAWLPAEARSIQPPTSMPAPSQPPEVIAPEPTLDAAPQPGPAAPEDDLGALRASLEPSLTAETPDWLAEVTPAESASAEMPDWLAEVAPTEPISAETPDWLAEVTPAEPASAEMPDWLAEVAPTEPVAPLAAAETPDWLAEVTPAEPASAEMPDWLAEVAPEETAAPLAPATPAETPDWLAEATPTETTAPAASPIEPSAAIPAEALDWLADVPASELASAGMSDLIKKVPSAEPAESSEPAQSTPAEAPDWLSALGGPTEPPAEPSEQAQSAPAEAPDWLSALGGPTETPAQPSEPAPPAAPAEAPDWLSALAPSEPPPQPSEPAPTTPAEISEQAAESAPVEPTASPVSSDAEDWLSGLAPLEPSAPSAEPSEPTTALPTEAPDWLSTLPEPKGPAEAAPVDPLLAEPAAGPPSPTQQAADDLFDWMSADMGLPVTTPTPAEGGEDLLGLTSDLTPPSPEQIETEPEAVEEPSAEPGGLPEWWQSAQPLAGPIEGEPSGTSSDLLDQISGLRFDAIVGSGAHAGAGEPEKVGALKDVVGVIQPEVVFEGGSLTAGGLAVESVITDDQHRRIERLKKLLDEEQKETSISAEQRMAFPLLRWLVIALLVAAIAAPVIMGINVLPDPQASSNAMAADQLLSTLPDASSTVLMAFEYEPESAAELQPLTVTLLKRIGSRKNVTIYAVSTKPTGPAMADDAFNRAFPPERETSSSAELAEAGESELATPAPGAEPTAPAQKQSGWINLGYVTGGANGISELVLGSPRGLPSRLAFDYRGQPTSITQAGLLEQPPALLVIVSARAEDLRPWIEQAGLVMDTPILIAVSAGSSPLALPYQRSGQVNAVLIGVGDTLSYQSLAGGSPDPALVATWNAQALGGLSAALAIIVGGLIYGLTSWRKHQEQGR